MKVRRYLCLWKCLLLKSSRLCRIRALNWREWIQIWTKASVTAQRFGFLYDHASLLLSNCVYYWKCLNVFMIAILLRKMWECTLVNILREGEMICDMFCAGVSYPSLKHLACFSWCRKDHGVDIRETVKARKRYSQ